MREREFVLPGRIAVRAPDREPTRNRNVIPLLKTDIFAALLFLK